MSIYEVARRAGVSKSTVSRVINSADNVSSDTVERVQRAMEEIGYIPSPRRPGPRPRPRSGLAAGKPLAFRHGTFAMVNVGRSVDQLNHPHFTRLQSEIGRLISEMRVSLVLDSMNADELPLCIREGRVDGVFLAGQSPRPDVARLIGSFPSVWLSAGNSGPAPADHVMADNDAIGRMAAEYLLGLGCQRPATANADPIGNSSISRTRAFKAYVREQGIEPLVEITPVEEPSHDDWEMATVRSRLKDLLNRLFDRPSPPDGLFIPYDQHAFIAWQLLMERGIRVGAPGPTVHVPMVTVYYDEVFVEPMDPKPALISVNLADMARWGVNRLVDRISGSRDRPVRVLVRPSLITVP